LYVFGNIGAVGIELWQVKSGTIFDNILVTDSKDEADAHAKKYYTDLKDEEKEAFDKAEALKREEEEAARKKAEEDRKATADSDDEDEDETDADEDDEERSPKEDL